MGKSKAKNVMKKVSDDVEKCEWFEWIAHSCTADGLVALRYVCCVYAVSDAGHRNGVRRGGDDREVEDVEGDERLL